MFFRANPLAIDLGSTNTVLAAVEQGSVRILSLPELARSQPLPQPLLIPSALFGAERRFWRGLGIHGSLEITLGQQALDRNFDGQSPAFAQGFKRDLATFPHRSALRVDGRELSVREVAFLFLQRLLRAVRQQSRLRPRDVTIPVPVGFYETYRAELYAIARRLRLRRFRTVDEPVAAALGHGINITRDETVLVVDFGGGTLDLAVIRLGPHIGEAGTVPVLAKHMVLLGGDDVDRWLMAHFVPIDMSDLPEWQQDLKWEVMRVKEEAGRTGAGEFRWNGICRTLTRADLAALLGARGLYAQLGTAMAEIRNQLAENREGEAGGVTQVLLVGGSTLLPEVAAVVDAAFPGAVVRHDPAYVFTAVALGAARFAGGVAVDDFVYHDYCLAVQNPQTHRVEYELLIPRRTRYPTEPDFAVRFYADYAGMSEMRFHVCEAGRLGQIPVSWQPRPNGGRYWTPQTPEDEAVIVPLNPAPVPLRPAGEGTSPRLRVTYAVDADRWLRTTVEDLVGRRLLHANEPVVRLR